MSWLRRKTEDRPRWVLDPLVGVGPLRFGMDSDEVKAALGGPLAGNGQIAADGIFWQDYQRTGLTCIFDRGKILVAVAVHALEGPLVRVGEVELIGRVPSELRADIHDLARSQDAVVRVNWSGDPEIPAWGLSLGTGQELGLSAEGWLEQKDTMVTSALLVGPGLAHDPYATAPVTHWRNVRERARNPGAWPVVPGHERPLWEWVPLERVGPLQFGMSPGEVPAALDGETPAARLGHFPHWSLGRPGQWHLSEDRFEKAGVSAHYWRHPDGVPRLGAVTSYGRTGPQVLHAGIPLVGVSPSALDAAIIQHIEDHDLGLRFCPSAAAVWDGLQLVLNTTRAGDAAVTEVVGVMS
ncbi:MULTISPECIES: hypothetical protein [unclassified Streptomyces]|uniref:hypothetical protein n=1 Tax=unclassified Streptomyces TaxID=2593676 RepID=UPI002E2F2562|nr:MULTISPECIES: hypothetical protein [unclassified Streptomyces]